MHKAVLLALALVISTPALAQPASCPEHFNQGEAPEFINQKLAAKTRALCFTGYAVMHSGVSRTPLWSAEFLSTERLTESKSQRRRNKFHAEERLPISERAELRDYARSGFDRGHMSPSGDMPDPDAQDESFSLANMVPQDAENNQRVWAVIEESTRKLARRRGALYVITGPIFEGDSLRRLNSRVLIPTHVYKAIYDPASGRAGAYIAPNAPGLDYQIISIAELEKRSGLNFFPRLDAKVKETAMPLPEPKIRKRRGE